MNENHFRFARIAISAGLTRIKVLGMGDRVSDLQVMVDQLCKLMYNALGALQRDAPPTPTPSASLVHGCAFNLFLYVL